MEGAIIMLLDRTTFGYTRHVRGALQLGTWFWATLRSGQYLGACWATLRAVQQMGPWFVATLRDGKAKFTYRAGDTYRSRLYLGAC